MSDELKPRLFVYPNPSGCANEQMDPTEAFEFIREWLGYASDGEGIELTVRHMTDAEVEALPDV